MGSLQTKLGGGLIISLIVVFALLWLLVSFTIQSLAEDYIASRLRHDAEMLLSTASFDKQGKITLDKSAIDIVYNQPFSGHYYFIATDNQSIYSRSLWDQKLTGEAVGIGESIRSYQNGPDHQLLLVLHNGFNKQGHQLSIIVAEDLNPVINSIRQFQTRFSMSAIGFLILLVIVQILALRFSLSSLTQLRNELQILKRGEIDQLTTTTPKEIQPLVNEVNRIVKVITRRLYVYRNSLGDLAHALKKPLTVIHQLVEQHRSNLPDSLYEPLSRQTTEINRLTERILKRARLAGQHQAGTRFFVSQDLVDLIHTLELMHNKTINVQQNIEAELDYQIDREDMLELLGNLLDNAFKWAKSTISITIKDKTGLTIIIEDDGPGAKIDKLNLLKQRGVRLDETRHGYGLGLAIASDMVHEYHGDMTFSKSEGLGGFRVDVVLPTNEAQYDSEEG